MGESKTEQIIDWLCEFLNTHTSNDGMMRDRGTIVDKLRSKLEETYEGQWAVIMGDFNSKVNCCDGNHVYFHLDNNESIEIYQENFFDGYKESDFTEDED